MKIWTLLLITILSGPMEGSQSYVLYPSPADCDRAATAVSETLAYDHTMICVEGDMVSSPRPKRNPIYEAGTP